MSVISVEQSFPDFNTAERIPSLWRRTSRPWNENTRISLTVFKVANLALVINAVYKPNIVSTRHRRSTTVSFETNPLFHLSLSFFFYGLAVLSAFSTLSITPHTSLKNWQRSHFFPATSVWSWDEVHLLLLWWYFCFYDMLKHSAFAF